MTEQKNALAQLFAACWKDEALKARFMADPKAVLKEHGLDVPDGMDVKVVENADDCVHITLPAPPAGDHDLSDDELSNAAGGTIDHGNDFVDLPVIAMDDDLARVASAGNGPCAC